MNSDENRPRWKLPMNFSGKLSYVVISNRILDGIAFGGNCLQNVGWKSS